ncbi:hypothetical protein QWY77_08270 [Thalassotalea ponticola]|uniref:hypothetical protein n=1 Tax=Thalassotalea ponticola TaxID=1523392 RepID=UPI0025B41973|nr:hypothetical protein [Thalassotalea ponticola]MDN3652759.1 hypothetical protein [Thalassotalea ponticola]
MFAIPSIPKPPAISGVAKDLNTSKYTEMFELGEIEFPIRDVKTIVSLIKSQETDKISPIDWLMLFCDPTQWSTTPEEEQLSSSELLWKAIINSKLATQIAASCIVRSLENELTIPSQSLIQAFKGLNSKANEMSVVLRIAFLLQMKRWPDLIKLALNQKSSLFDLFENSKLLLSNQVREKLVSLTIRNLNLLDDEQSAWLVTHLSQINDTELAQSLKDMYWCFAEKPFTKNDDQNSNKKVYINEDNIGDDLADWLGENCNSEKQISLKLDKQVSIYISKISNIPHYSKFQNIIHIIGSRSQSHINISKPERNQLFDRMRFFGYYQTQMSDLVVYLPPSSYQITKEKLSNIEDFVFEFQDDLSVEVGIFKIKNLICVEVFRAPKDIPNEQKDNYHNSRFYLESSIEGQALLKNRFKNINEILTLKPMFKHDHKKYWHSALEEKLRTTQDVAVDRNVKRIVIARKYSEELKKIVPINKRVKEGIPTPLNEHEKLERYADIYHWQREYKRPMYDIELSKAVSDTELSYSISYVSFKKSLHNERSHKVKVKARLDCLNSMTEAQKSALMDGENFYISELTLPELNKFVCFIDSKNKGVHDIRRTVIGTISIIEELGRY